MAKHPLVHLHKRSSNPVPPPAASGILTSAVTATPGSPSATVLATATSGVPVGQLESPSFSLSPSTTPLTSSVASTPAGSTSATAVADASSSSSADIPLGTVIGACVGALAGALILILVGLWLYRRSDPKKRRPTRTGPGLQPNWNKLGDDDDKWEGMHKTKEVAEVAPMEKLTMFKKSTPSIYTTKSASEVLPAFDFGAHPFSQYHPNLAKELASSNDETRAPPFRTDSSAVSWDGDTVGGASFRSARMSGAMSPSLDIARPTPALTNSEPHRWESAEVVHLEGHVADVVHPDLNNPFVHPTERRKSEHNPFFGSSSLRSPSASKPNKGKGREITPPQPVANPFADSSDVSGEKTPTHLTFTHAAVDSVSSVSSNDRAIQSLIAALGSTPEEVQERLNFANVAPSIVSDSGDSIYTTAGYTTDGDEDEDEEDADNMTDSFPLPPGSDHSS